MPRRINFKAEIVAEICRRLEKGEPLTVICRSQPTFPDPATVWRWAEADKEVAQAIARAREVGHDAIAEECLAIANTPVEGTETTIDEKGVSIKKADALGHRKLQIETRLKLLAKWNPKKYGDRVALEHSGEIGLADRLKAARERARNRDG